jgi:hypothetical protein
MAWAAQSGAGRLRFRCRVAVHRLSVTLMRARLHGLKQCVDIGRTLDDPVTQEDLAVVLDAFPVM